MIVSELLSRIEELVKSDGLEVTDKVLINGKHIKSVRVNGMPEEGVYPVDIGDYSYTRDGKKWASRESPDDIVAFLGWLE